MDKIIKKWLIARIFLVLIGIVVLGTNKCFAENTHNGFFLRHLDLIAGRIKPAIDYTAIGIRQTVELEISCMASNA